MPRESLRTAVRTCLTPVVWPLVALGALIVFNVLTTDGFSSIEIRSGRLHGVPLDILRHASIVALLAIGMALVIAVRGIDLSVGAVMAIAAAVSATIANAAAGGVGLAICAALLVGALCGLWNALLVTRLGLQPIVATLVLMVAGRGVAQLICAGQVVVFNSPGVATLGSGAALGLPIPVHIVLLIACAVALLLRITPLRLFIESIGENPAAARCAGVAVDWVRIAAYCVCGTLAGLAGLLAAADIRAADANHVGRFLELDAIIAVVIGGGSLSGGRVRLVGALLGAAFIQTLTTTLYLRDVPADVAPAFKAIAVLLICTIRSDRAHALGLALFRRRLA